MSNIVAIVGRPNVGKSTLFNRLTESRQAITDEVSGVTRDRHYGKSEWGGKEFSVIDTGGYITGSEDIYEGEIRKQVELAIDEANVILFIVDAKVGITEMDTAVVQLLRKTAKKTLVVANKTDNSTLLEEAVEFYNLGMGDYFPVSSMTGSGTGELLDELTEYYNEKNELVQKYKTGKDLFDEYDELVSIMYGKSVKNFDGKRLPSIIEFVPLDEGGNKTIVERLVWKFDLYINSRFFMPNYMKNLR